MQPPRVVNPRDETYQVYIGRESVYRICKPVCKTRTADQAKAEYEALWRRRLASTRRRLWLERLLALTGKAIGCWGPCWHGDVLVKLWHEFVEDQA